MPALYMSDLMLAKNPSLELRLGAKSLERRSEDVPALSPFSLILFSIPRVGEQGEYSIKN